MGSLGVQHGGKEEGTVTYVVRLVSRTAPHCTAGSINFNDNNPHCIVTLVMYNIQTRFNWLCKA